MNKPDVQVAYSEDGVAVGVTSEGETAKAKLVVGDPSYFPGKVRKTSRVGQLSQMDFSGQMEDAIARVAAVWHVVSSSGKT